MSQRNQGRASAHPDLLDQVLEAVTTAIAVLRAPGLVIELANGACRELAGGRPLLGRMLAEVNPEAAARLQPLLERVLATGEPLRLDDVALQLGSPPGSPGPARTFALTLERLPPDDQGAPSVLVLAQETTAQLRARREVERALATEQAARARLAEGQRLTAALAAARTVQEVADAVFQNGLAAFGAEAGWIALPDDRDHLTVAASFGYAEERLRPWQRFAIALDVPIAEAFRTGQAIFVESLAELTRRYPLLARASQGRTVCLAALPFLVDDGVTGGLALTFAAERAFSDEDRVYAGWLAQKCAQALERARSHEAERVARAQAVEIGRLQEQLIAVVGHDLRSPLTAITTTAAALARRGGLDERQAVGLERIAGSAARMGAIIRDLLDLSVARSGRGLPVHREATDLAELARRAVQEAEAGGAEGRLSLRSQGDSRVDADPVRLGQVLANLMDNALQHGAGSPVEVTVDGRPAEVLLQVHNGGPPIEPDLLPHVFEPFRRGEVRAAEGGGRSASIGLGLFIVWEIMRAHGGTVAVRSSAAEGTTFEARLPRTPAPAPVSGGPAGPLGSQPA